MQAIPERQSIADRLNDPQTAEVLHRLLDRAQSMDQMLGTVGELPNMLAIAVDFFDATCRRAAEDGVDIETRAARLLKLLIQVTEPNNMQAMERLVSRLPRLEEGSALLDELPGLVATAMDVFDEWASRQKAQGIDLEQSVRRGLHAALYLGGKLNEAELSRIGFLLKSEVLSKNSVATVGMAGAALSSCHQGSCEHPVAKRVGFWGMLKAMRDPNTQRALSFALQFAKCFGGVLDKTPAGDLCSPMSSPSPSAKG
ncbi:MAG: DUF1641 domain-containing protein [Planctomycetaceae bacterium]|nr:DUF1641 domain-containing protein [Planctomycetaceae bacterium]